MTRYYYDTEFHERGPAYPIDFISIGIVSENDDTYYAVNDGFNVMDAYSNHWLRENVMKFIPLDASGNLDFSDPTVKSRALIKCEIESFFRRTNISGTEVELWAYYGDYDHVVLSQIFGRMIDLPEIMPMRTEDLAQEAKRLCILEHIPRADPSTQHHALYDAMRDREIHRFIMEYERSILL